MGKLKDKLRRLKNLYRMGKHVPDETIGWGGAD